MATLGAPTADERAPDRSGRHRRWRGRERPHTRRGGRLHSDHRGDLLCGGDWRPWGAYSLAGASAPPTDPAGTDDGAGASAPTLAAAAVYIPITGAAPLAAEIVDPAGAYSLAGASAATTDPAGGYSGPGSSAPTLAAPGAYIPVTGATSSATEFVDPSGACLAGASASAPTTDSVSRYSAAGAGGPMLAARDASIPVSGATSAAAKIVSPPGTYLPPGASAPIADPGGTYSAAGASAPTTDPAGTYSSPYALNCLVIVGANTTPATAVLPFHSETAVANYYGATSEEATWAKEFFAGYAGTSATMLFTRFGSWVRTHLLGANISNLTLSELQSIKGSIALTFQGYTYSGSIDLSGVESFPAAGNAIQNALNSNLQVAAVTAGSSIAPVSVSFKGSINGARLQVTSVSSGSIEVGGIVSGPGIKPGSQIIAQQSGTPGGAGQYLFFGRAGTVPSETMTETYGVLTVGSVNSGTVAVGQEVTGAGVLPVTAIDRHLSGSGLGSKWIVDNAQTVAGDITMTATPFSVSNKSFVGATENNDFFEIEPNGAFGFDNNPSSLSYMSGTAAAALGLTQLSGAINSSPGGHHPTAPEFMTNLVQNEYGQFGSFQSNIPRISRGLAYWARSTDGYRFIPSIVKTPPAGSSAPTTDPAGTWSGRGASAPTPAQPGTYIPYIPGGATSITAQITDPAGSYSLAGASAPTLAQPGYYVPGPGASQRDAGPDRLVHTEPGHVGGAPGAGPRHIGHGRGAVHSVRAD